MVYSQSYVKTPDGRLSETENKRVIQISGLKSGRGRLRSLRVIAYERYFKTVFNWEKKRVIIFSKLSRSLTGGVRLREVVTMRDLTPRCL